MYVNFFNSGYNFMKVKLRTISKTAFCLTFSFLIVSCYGMEENISNDQNLSKKALCYMPAEKLLELYRSLELSPVDVLEAQIDHIESNDHLFNAISSKHYDEARHQAKEAELRYKNGTYRALEGITVLIKNEMEVKGWVVTLGSKILENAEPCTEDGAIITFLRDAGAIMHAQTNVPEFCCNVVTWSKLSGICRNPWNTAYTPGGSSGGSAAALAAGFGTLALGSDMGGSIRIPASMTGTYGFKPPYGRVPTSLVQYESYGPMARNITDLSLLQKSISGISPKVISSIPVEENYLERRGNIRGWKIAYDPMTEWGLPIDNTIKKALEESVERLRSLGAIVEEIDLGFRASDFDTYGLGLLSTSMGYLCLNEPAKYPDLITSYMKSLVDKYAEQTSNKHIAVAEDWIKSKHYQIQEKVFLQEFKAIIMPTMCTPYVTADMGITPENTIVTINNEKYPADTWAYILTWPWNMLGQYPVMNVPIGKTIDNIPLGMQIISNTYKDDVAFQISFEWSKLASEDNQYLTLLTTSS